MPLRSMRMLVLVRMKVMGVSVMVMHTLAHWVDPPRQNSISDAPPILHRLQDLRNAISCSRFAIALKIIFAEGDKIICAGSYAT